MHVDVLALLFESIISPTSKTKALMLLLRQAYKLGNGCKMRLISLIDVLPVLKSIGLHISIYIKLYYDG